MHYQPTRPRLILYLEWILLGITAMLTVIISLIDIEPGFPFLAIVCIGILAVLGLHDPKSNHQHKYWLTMTELGLMVLPTFMGDRIPNFPVLGMVLMLRSARRLDAIAHYVVVISTYIYCILSIFSLEISPRMLFNQVFAFVHRVPITPLSALVLKTTTAFYTGIMLSLILLLINTLTQERKNREYLSDALAQLRQYSLRLENQVALQERNRIAREIHDALGHTLTAQSVQLDSGLVFLNAASLEQAQAFFETAKELCTQALQETRQSVSMLRSDRLVEASLETAIATLIKDVKATTTMTIDWGVELSQPISSDLSSTLYRIIQAALTNIIRHSEATEATLQLTDWQQTLYLVIKDNGRGFNPKQNSTGFGLQGMRERTLALDGQFSLVSEPGAGCLITIQIPLPRLLP